MLKGSIVALITPMQADGAIDQQSLQQLIEWHIDSKTDGLVVIGTTGESPTLTADEQDAIITAVVKQVAGRIPVIAGTGTNCTETTIKRSQRAQQLGADACLVVTPYYNKPPQKGLFEHYKKVANAISIPLILYNVPGRTGCDLLPETVEQLSAIQNIVGVKEGRVAQGSEIIKRCGKNFAVYSGDDDTALALILSGGHGVISVAANIIPQKMHDLCVAALSGNKALAEKMNAELTALYKNLFLEANPIPVKWALNEMGLIPPGIRLPLVPLNTQFHQVLREILQQIGLIQPIKTI